MRKPVIRYVCAILLLILFSASCIRRDLWVYTDDMRQDGVVPSLESGRDGSLPNHC